MKTVVTFLRFHPFASWTRNESREAGVLPVGKIIDNHFVRYSGAQQSGFFKSRWEMKGNVVDIFGCLFLKTTFVNLV